jgi:hypothetical protein
LLKKLRGEREAERMKASAPPEPEKPKERMSADRASQILAEAGFAPKRFGGDGKHAKAVAEFGKEKT